MLSGVSTICFAASYAVALALEISRLLFRSGVRRAIMLGFAAAGLMAHTAFLYYRAVKATGAPLSSQRDWYLVAAWALVAVYLYLALFRSKAPFGLFLLPLSLGLIAVATFLAPDQPLAREPASRVWAAIHGISIMLATVAVLVGFVAGLMYLGQVWHLKHKIMATRGPRLPSLEWLGQANGRAIVVSVFMLGMGVLSGMVLNLINVHSEANYLPLSDPVIWSTWLMFFWLLAAVVLSALHHPARQGRKVAYLTVASFVFLAIMLTVGLLANSRHWERGRGDRPNFRANENGTVPFSPPEGGKGADSRGEKNTECRMQNDEFTAMRTLPDHASAIHPSSFILHPSPLASPLSSLPSCPSCSGGRPC